MTSYTTGRFWRLYALLPLEIRKQAKTSYLQFRDDPYYLGCNLSKSIQAIPFIRFELVLTTELLASWIMAKLHGFGLAPRSV